MSNRWVKHLSRILCLCLCFTMLSSAMAETGTPINEATDFWSGILTTASAPLPTPTPEPTVPASEDTTKPATPPANETASGKPTEVTTDEPTDEPAGEPTDPSTDEPTGEPADPSTDEPTGVPTDPSTDEPTGEPTDPSTDEPTGVPTDPSTDEPTGQPTDPSTGEPSQLPTDVPTDVPTAEPTETITPLPSPENTWDETLCDHTTADCEQAPDCLVEGCKHIGLNETGDVVALCALGQWLFDAADAQSSGEIALFSASAPTGIALEDGENLIYRSGTYVLSGGGSNASFHVRSGLVVSLILQSAELRMLKLGSGVRASLGFQGQNTIATIAAGDSSITIDGSGSLYVENNVNCSDLNALGGSIHLPSGASSGNGRFQNVFAAKGATSVTLDGKALSSIQPYSGDGNAYLWLPSLPQDAEYFADVQGSTLAITTYRQPPTTDVSEIDLSGDGDFTAEAGKAYNLIASDSGKQSRKIIVSAANTSFVMDGKGTGGTAPSFEINKNTTIFISGSNAIASLSGSGTAQLSGSGKLQIGTADIAGITAAGSMNISCDTLGTQAVGGWVTLDAGQNISADTTAQFNGKSIPLLYSSQNAKTAYVLLAKASKDFSYVGNLNGNELVVSEVPLSGSYLKLGGIDLTLRDGEYNIKSDSSASGSLIIQAGATVALSISGVSTAGKIDVGANANVTINLSGSSTVGSLSLGSNAQVFVTGTGALSAGSASGGGVVTVHKDTNLVIQQGSSLPGNSFVKTVIVARNNKNVQMINQKITLKIGTAEPFETTTDNTGCVTLWREKALHDVDVVILAGRDTYTTIVKNGEAVPDALPVISGETVINSKVVQFKASNATTMGIQYYVSTARYDMPDAYDSNAKIAMMKNGEVVIPDLRPGDIVTYRAFGCIMPDAKLNEQTQDAFGFGKRQYFEVKDTREKFTLSEQSKTYDNEKFAFKSSLIPSGAGIEYYENGVKLSKAPTDVGDYIARVIIPEGNEKYLAGSYDVAIKIKRIIIEIIPMPAFKYIDEADPLLEFIYDYDLMLGDDYIDGFLSREEGEEYGNYAYLLEGLSAPEYYLLVLAEDSPLFFIDLTPKNMKPYDPLGIINPVYDEIHFSDGKMLSTQIRTIDMLRLNETYYGCPVTDTIDGKDRPFTTSLRLRGGYDEALLVLTAEAELNKDGGYETDADGNKIIRGRDLKMSYSMLNNLTNQRVKYIGFALDGTMVVVSIDDINDGLELQKLMAKNETTRIGTTFHITLEPIADTSSILEDEASAGGAMYADLPMMRVSVTLQKGDVQYDIASALGDAKVLFDIGDLLPETQQNQVGDVTESINGQPVVKQISLEERRNAEAIAGVKGEIETSYEMLELAETLIHNEFDDRGLSMMRYGMEALPLDTKVVVPFTQSESKTMMFTAVMRTRPYFASEFTVSGLYGILEQVQ
ncbi:MAG: hypothetical protein GX096_13960 [Clostridiales bacterium]|nr:hypothetical protein [Clostridiales bacterium]